jgi:hypothetical protein
MHDEWGRNCGVPRSPTDTCPAEDAGVAQLVEHQPSKLRVAGSSPVARLSGQDVEGGEDGEAEKDTAAVSTAVPPGM